MSDLHAAIHQRVAQRLTITTDEMPSGRVAQVNNWIERGYGALEAVLDLHARDERGECACCYDGGPNHPWPCPTVLAIAEKLGIEVS